MPIRYLLTSISFVVAISTAWAQSTPIPLWPKGAPEQIQVAAPATVRITATGEHVITHVVVPSITPYLPAPGTGTGAAVIVVPGGGHSEIWIDHEGYAVAQYLSLHGIAAFVLEYRLAREAGSSFTVEGTELGDMQRAIRLIRSRATEWHLDPLRVGVMGFSAGGELAALASTRYATSQAAQVDTIDQLSAKPAFQALLYPALPQNPRLSPETPAAFLACGADDRPSISEGLPQLELALSRLHVLVELHIYAHTGHGFGIRKSNPEPIASWPALFVLWLDQLFTAPAVAALQ